jgi:hypothetical protein
MLLYLYTKMKEAYHKYKDDWVILRYDDKDINWKKNWRSEYWTWTGWKPWLKNAKIYWHEDSAREALVMIRVKKANLPTDEVW